MWFGCSLHSHREPVKSGRFDLSTITSWQSTTTRKSCPIHTGGKAIRCVSRAQVSSMVQTSLDRSTHGPQLSEGRRQGELKEASTRVHRQRQFGKHC